MSFTILLLPWFFYFPGKVELYKHVVVWNGMKWLHEMVVLSWGSKGHYLLPDKLGNKWRSWFFMFLISAASLSSAVLCFVWWQLKYTTCVYFRCSECISAHKTQDDILKLTPYHLPNITFFFFQPKLLFLVWYWDFSKCYTHFFIYFKLPVLK